MQVRNWRNPEFGAADSWYWYLDGYDWTLTRVTQLPERVEHAMRPFVSVPMAAPPGPTPPPTLVVETPPPSPAEDDNGSHEPVIAAG